MNEKKNRANPWIILHPMILGTVLGVLAGGVVCFFQTKMYVSRAVLAAKGEPDGRTVDLAPIHAAQAIFLTDGTMGKPDGDAVKSLCRNTRVRAADGFVEIVVADPDKVRARDIATELTWLFRGMDAEASLGGAASDLPAISEDAREGIKC